MEPEDSQCKEELSFEMSVARVYETPRSTKPYAESVWTEIDQLGKKLDQELEESDARLSFGGEPTFVSADDRDAPEWTIAALGAGKRRLSGTLLRRLRDRFAPGALLYFGQGKWYPGESLPRWTLSCYWRHDREPIWRNPELIANDSHSYGFGPDEAKRFMSLLCERLELDPSLPVPAFEDTWYYLWRERRLPSNVDPLASRLEDPEERTRLAKIFDQGLATVVGLALPLRRLADGGSRWESGRWLLRGERLYLTPGDSPMGFRLPLDSLPWEAPKDLDSIVERDPMAPRGHLPPHPTRGMTGPEWQRRHSSRQSSGTSERTPDPPPKSRALVRTALCVEPRDGRLHVFLPPLANIEDYLDLVARVEATASELNMPVLVEGYPPPFDHRIRHFSVTPDPGVIEVNIHPTLSWKELVSNTSILYEEARQTGLTAEKFLVDGRPSGTGGGNHLVIGGPSPPDSPILRRPDLLRSLTAYWHNHPSLSYLFSGLFIGPTSQAPRVDEARNDSLYELELAFHQIAEREGAPGPTPLWQVDRLFRHLLIDATGNTHRAEFCIDKLYSPDGTSGRRGLLELRSIEMPPHERMSLTQQLLVRALIAWFWKTPYKRRLVRWGTELHDRYLLPHFLEQDFRDVIEDLRIAGYPIEESWFAPHKEFRFPLIGGVMSQGVQLELRPALEPWHVLGEEQGAGGTARFVDSSVERIQIKVEGLTDDRHVVTCNGRLVPLFPTGTVGERVAGVRFRAWQPPSSLHPLIPAQGPLVFDLIDTWRERAVGGCTYHVSHPGGRSFDTLPINASEAEGRWQARFWPFGHTPGTMQVPPVERQPEFPLTLDLRQPDPRRKESNDS